MVNRILALLCALVCAAGPIRAAAPPAPSSIRLHLKLEAHESIPASVRNDAIVEAARIWAPYGVLLDATEGAGCTPPQAALQVVFDPEPAADEEEGSLGVLRFGSDGVPASLTTVHYDAVSRLVSSQPVMGVDPSHWPVRLHNELLARALGRTLAHEVGHFLLRWPHHTEAGLMQREYRASTLVDPDPTAFALTAVDRARLQIVAEAAVFAAPAVAADASLCRLIASSAGSERQSAR